MSHTGFSESSCISGQSNTSVDSALARPVTRAGSAVPARQPRPSGVRDSVVPSGRRALSGLSNRELLSRVRDLVSRERAVTLEILVHLNEVERRRLYLGLGYASLFEYCVRHLGYSSSAAGRRIPAARCIRDYPEIYGLLERNEMNLITVSLVAPILTRSNAKDLIERVRGKTQREVEEIVAEYRPPLSMRDRAKPVCVRVTKPVTGMPDTSGQVCPRTPTGGSEISPNAAGGDGVAAPPVAGTETPAAPKPRLERKFLVQFLASAHFMKKFERAKALLSNKNGSMSYEAVLEAALDELLKDHDPEKRQQRREEKKQKAEARVKSGVDIAKRMARCQAKGSISTAGCGQVDGRPVSTVQAGSGQVDDPLCECDRAGGGQADGPLFRRGAGGLPSTRVVTDPSASRRIPAAVRDAVFVRDKGRCTFMGSDGRRCGSTQNLQIDHIVPFACGGTASIRNLRLLCGKHNRLSAERAFGP